MEKSVCEEGGQVVWMKREELCRKMKVKGVLKWDKADKAKSLVPSCVPLEGGLEARHCIQAAKKKTRK